MPLNPDALVGKNISSPNRTGYHIERILGQGAFGTTYKVRSLSNNREFALKALHKTQTHQELFDFFQEALTLVRLKHPHIVEFKEFGRDPQEDVTFIVMALANNASLGDRRMPLSADYAVRYSVQAASGLQRAHAENITHRDVKSDNLLLHQHPNNPHLEVWVTDFGIALATHSFDKLQKQEVVGSVDYMAPEHILGNASEKSDQYSLAVVTYEELTGRLPYEGNTAEVLRGHLYEDIPPFSKKGVKEDDKLKGVEPVVRRGLAKEEYNRYPTIQAFADDLAEKLADVFAATATQKIQGKPFSAIDMTQMKNNVPISPERARAEIQRCINLFNQEKYVEALQASKRAIALDPNNADAWFYKGLSLCRFGKWEETLELYDRALELNPTNYVAMSNKGDSLYQLSRHVEALQTLDKALQFNSRYDPAWFFKGNALHALGRYEEALAAYDEAINLNRKTTRYNNKGNALHALGRDEEAIVAYDEAINLDPKNSLPYNNKGNALHALGRDEEALAVYDQAIKINPQYSNAYANKGETLCALGKYNEASVCFQEALARNPSEEVVRLIDQLKKQYNIS